VRKPQTKRSRFEWIGGWLCLDFSNTVSWNQGGLRNERLASYPDLISWTREAALMTKPKAKPLLKKASHEPLEAAKALERAIKLRKAIHGIFSAVAHQRPAEVGHLQAFNRELAKSLTRMQIASKETSFGWSWPDGEDDLEQVLWPVAWSAAQLLTSKELAKVRECANANCGWLFVDASRIGNRRWCDMKECGSRAKARRYYQRKRKSAPSPLRVRFPQG
jgi:predicted RNA-binding Zn ribbon-like protein